MQTKLKIDPEGPKEKIVLGGSTMLVYLIVFAIVGFQHLIRFWAFLTEPRKIEFPETLYWE